MGRHRYASLLVPALLLALAPAGPALSAGAAAAASDRRAQPLRLDAPEVPARGAVRVLAHVPAAMSRRALPDSVFSARQDGRPIDVAGRRVADEAHLVLAVDTTVDRQVLAAEQAAAADLLRALPPDLPTVVLPGGVPTTARQAVSQVGALRPGSADLLAGRPETASGPGWLVAFSDCPALERLPAPLGSPDLPVSLLVTGSACDERARTLVAPTGGTVRTGLADPSRLIAASDQVAAELLGQYRLRLAADSAGGPVQVVVASSGLVAQASLPLGSAPASASPAATAGVPTPDPRSRVVLIGLALLTAVGAVVYAVRDLRAD